MTQPSADGAGSVGRSSRRVFLGLGAVAVAAGISAAAVAADGHDAAGPASRPTAGRPRGTARRALAENSRPGDPYWEIRHLGAPDAIEGYAGASSVRTGESFPLFVSTPAAGFRVTAFRLGWYGGDGARRVWRSGPLRGHRQHHAGLAGATNTVRADWDPSTEVPTDDWPPGAYLLRLDADSGAQRYVPVTVRSLRTAGQVIIKNCVATWQAYNTWGGYDLYAGPGSSYGTRSLAVSLDRPYDANGAAMFLTYERNVIKLAERMGLPLAYLTGMDIDADPHVLDGASALISPGHDEYWTPAERAHVTAARDAGVNLAFLGANAMFRRIRLDATAVGPARLVICYKTSYARDPMYGVQDALVTSDWREPPRPDPESSLIGTLYEGYPAVASYVVAAPDSWVFAGTGVTAGTRLRNLVGVEYDRVNPAYPVPRPIHVLSHSPLICQGAASYGDSAYYTHAGGAGVFNAGTMRWVEAIFGDRPHGISGAASAFVRQATANVLRAFADGPAADAYPARDNLDTMHEYAGDPIGNAAGLQLAGLQLAGLLAEQPGDRAGQPPGELGEEPLAFGRRGTGRVAEDAVRAYGEHPVLVQHGQDLAEGPDIAFLGDIEPHRLGGQREHDRRLEPAGVRVAAREPGVPDVRNAVLVAEPADRRPDRGGVAAVPVDQQQGGPVQARVAAKLDQAGGQRLRADRQRAGEVRVFAAGADADRGRQGNTVPARAGPPRHGHGDPGVGVEWQVRPVLLQRPHRHHKQPPRAVFHLGPPLLSQFENGRPSLYHARRPRRRHTRRCRRHKQHLTSAEESAVQPLGRGGCAVGRPRTIRTAQGLAVDYPSWFRW